MHKLALSSSASLSIQSGPQKRPSPIRTSVLLSPSRSAALSPTRAAATTSPKKRFSSPIGSPKRGTASWHRASGKLRLLTGRAGEVPYRLQALGARGATLSTAALTQPWYTPPPEAASAAQEFDDKHARLTSKARRVMLELDGDITSDRKEKEYKRTLLEIRYSRLHLPRSMAAAPAHDHTFEHEALDPRVIAFDGDDHGGHDNGPKGFGDRRGSGRPYGQDDSRQDGSGKGDETNGGSTSRERRHGKRADGVSGRGGGTPGGAPTLPGRSGFGAASGDGAAYDATVAGDGYANGYGAGNGSAAHASLGMFANGGGALRGGIGVLDAGQYTSRGGGGVGGTGDQHGCSHGDDGRGGRSGRGGSGGSDGGSSGGSSGDGEGSSGCGHYDASSGLGALSVGGGGYRFFEPAWPEMAPSFREGSVLCKRQEGGGGGLGSLFDTGHVLNQALRFDWSWAVANKLDAFIARNDASSKGSSDATLAAHAVERVRAVLAQYYGLVLSLFEYYACLTVSSNPDDIYNINMNEYISLLNDCELSVPHSLECEKGHLEQLFIAIDAGQDKKEEFNAKRALSRQEFLQMLVHISVRRWVRPRKQGTPPLLTDVAEALRTLLVEHLPPRLNAAALQVSNEFRLAYLYLPETDATLAYHLHTLQSLFVVYADMEHAHTGSGALASATLLSFDEWLLFCHHLELIDYDFTMREATLCFTWSKLRVANESDPKARRRMTNLRFEDFMEAIVRIATMKCVPTDAEVEAGGFDDGGQMLLALRSSPAEDRAFRASRPAEWNMPLRQPIWRCVHHLIAFMARVVAQRVHGSTSTGALKPELSRREVAAFKAHGLSKGVDERGRETAAADHEKKGGRRRVVVAPAPSMAPSA